MPYQAYVINLDRSPERLVSMSERLDALGFPWQRVSAVEGNTLSSHEWQKVDQKGYLRHHGKKITPGEIGCYLSHIKSLKTFLDSNFSHALVLEDDAKMIDGFMDLMDAAWQQKAHWDILHLSGHREPCPQRLCALDDTYDLVVYLTRQTGSGAYAINRYAAQRMVDRLLPISLPFDHAFNQAWRFSIRQRAIHPLPINQSTFMVEPSTIDQEAIHKGRLPWWQKGPTMLFRTYYETVRFFYGIIHLIKWYCSFCNK